MRSQPGSLIDGESVGAREQAGFIAVTHIINLIWFKTVGRRRRRRVMPVRLDAIARVDCLHGNAADGRRALSRLRSRLPNCVTCFPCYSWLYPFNLLFLLIFNVQFDIGDTRASSFVTLTLIFGIFHSS